MKEWSLCAVGTKRRAWKRATMDDRQTGRDGAPGLDPFDVHVGRHGKTAILRLSGEFDIARGGDLDSLIQDLSGNSPDEVIIDLRGVTFLDSSGLRSLNRARLLGPETGWSLKLVQGGEQVQRIFEVTGMAAVFEFADASEID
jgi:anti-sigma B factor antagonist